MKRMQTDPYEWMLVAVVVLLLWAATVGCTATDPTVEIDRGGKAAPRDAELVIDGWTTQQVGDVWLVLPGSIRHDVRQPRAEPTVAVTAGGAAGWPGVPWWGWWVGGGVLLVGAAWYVRPWLRRMGA